MSLVFSFTVCGSSSSLTKYEKCRYAEIQISDNCEWKDNQQNVNGESELEIFILDFNKKSINFSGVFLPAQFECSNAHTKN